jgi:predicted neuraminidase
MSQLVSLHNGDTWNLYYNTDTEKGSVRAGHEYSYPACVPWPEDSAEEGVSVSYTWHRRRMVFFSLSLAHLRAMAKPLEVDSA